MSGISVPAANPNWLGTLIALSSTPLQVFSSTNLKKIREIANASTTGAIVYICASSTGSTAGLVGHVIPAARPFRLTMPMMSGNIWAYSPAGVTGLITAFSA